MALDRAYNVAWALRGPPAQQAALRATLGWIAVSGEDDKLHRPVNVPPPPYEQYEIEVLSQGQNLATRFFIASAVEPPPRVAAQRMRELPEDPPPPTIPDDHQLILFLHGHGSGAEEALAIIPALLKAGLERGVKYSVLSLDLPNNGYSKSFNHLFFFPRQKTTYPKRDGDKTHIATPILDFIENFIVDFVDSLPVAISRKLVAVIGGSLGGNLSLRLGRRDLSGKSWMIPAIVSWSPASVWPPLVPTVVLSFDYIAPGTCFDRCVEVEQAESRDYFFYQSYEESNGPIHAQPEYWYRDNWVLKPFHNEIVKFLNAQTRFIVCVTKKDGMIQSYGVKNNAADHNEQPVQWTLDECIEAIERGDDFYSVSGGGDKAYVFVSHNRPIGPLGDPGGENRGYYLTTRSNPRIIDNIVMLRRC